MNLNKEQQIIHQQPTSTGMTWPDLIAKIAQDNPFTLLACAFMAGAAIYIARKIFKDGK